MTTKQDLIGHWTMIECLTEKPGEPNAYPIGAKARGALIYTPDYMAALIEHEDGVYASYGGHWDFDGEAVHHHAKFNSDKKRIGTTLTRAAKLDGDVLTLSTIPKREGDARMVLYWKRGG